MNCFKLFFFLFTIHLFAKVQEDKIVYHLTVDYQKVNFTGNSKQAMGINGSIPAPTLKFKEGKTAVIYVTNKMDVETSIHWHGILLPNFQDGVPYLTTPPIKPNSTHKFEFTLTHSGTYWYHSHTNLQEQKGVYGAIIVEPKTKTIDYDKELVLVLSDWTDEDPSEVLRSLRRGTEWYSIKKGDILSLNKVLKNNAFKDLWDLWKMRMHGIDISDVYYDAFLINGKKEQNYPNFKSGEKVRVRIINAGASSYFWLSFGGKNPTLVSADGVDVKPFKTNKVLNAIAETYDFIITIPKNNSIEITATAQDGSGMAKAILGKGKLLKAPIIPKINLYEEMRSIAKKHLDFHHKMHGSKMMHHKMKSQPSPKKAYKHNPNQFSYDDLAAIEKTKFPHNKTVKNIKLNLTGNMWRYIWTMNRVPLSEADKIKIKRGEIVRITLENQTMMHHPMHLHGHFFRVLNKNGDYSPLKHTVNVPPFETVVIEFDAKEKGDWFFHCHVLYHMKGGMARVFSYGDKRDERLKNFPEEKVLNSSKHWFYWGELNILTNRFDLNLTSTNDKNLFTFDSTFAQYEENSNTKKELEVDINYYRFTSDFFRAYTGINLENENKKKLSKLELQGHLGFKYLLPLFFDFSFSVDTNLKPKIELEYELLLFPRLEMEWEWEWKLDHQPEWQIGFECIIKKNLSALISYNNHYSLGLGLNWKF